MVVKALAHPLRVRVLEVLGEGPASPVELSRRLGESLGVVSYHVRVLDGLGVIRLAKETAVRGAIEHTYELAEGVRLHVIGTAADGAALDAAIEAFRAALERPEGRAERSVVLAVMPAAR